MRPSMIALAVLATLTASAAHANSTVTLQDREQAACYGDVQSLCGTFIPDVEKTTTCMLSKRSQVSAGCAKYFPPDQPAG